MTCVNFKPADKGWLAVFERCADGVPEHELIPIIGWAHDDFESEPTPVVFDNDSPYAALNQMIFEVPSDRLTVLKDYSYLIAPDGRVFDRYGTFRNKHFDAWWKAEGNPGRPRYCQDCRALVAAQSFAEAPQRTAA